MAPLLWRRVPCSWPASDFLLSFCFTELENESQEKRVRKESKRQQPTSCPSLCVARTGAPHRVFKRVLSAAAGRGGQDQVTATEQACSHSPSTMLGSRAGYRANSTRLVKGLNSQAAERDAIRGQGQHRHIRGFPEPPVGHWIPPRVPTCRGGAGVDPTSSTCCSCWEAQNYALYAKVSYAPRHPRGPI